MKIVMFSGSLLFPSQKVVNMPFNPTGRSARIMTYCFERNLSKHSILLNGMFRPVGSIKHFSTERVLEVPVTGFKNHQINLKVVFFSSVDA